MARSRELTPTHRARICELHGIEWGYRRMHTRYSVILSHGQLLSSSATAWLYAISFSFNPIPSRL
jgi:hypothetical protein